MYVHAPHLFQSVCNVNLSWVVCWFLVLDLCKSSLRIEVMKMKFEGALFIFPSEIVIVRRCFISIRLLQSSCNRNIP
jgi:hypothetical protein